jgi:hypothetical protein
MKTAKFLSIKQKDFIKALWMFIISSAISIVGDAIMQLISMGVYSLSEIHWREIGLTILVSVLSYLKKNLLTNSNDEFLKKDDKQPI